MNNPLLAAAQQVMSSIVQNNMQGNLMNTPWRDSAIQAIQSGDEQTGQQLADNIIKSCGFSSPQEAIQQGLANLSKRR